ncbi:MAG: polyribonucleotide nucleotidyltransferase [Candidatus Magasanikbacteria bacterium]
MNLNNRKYQTNIQGEEVELIFSDLAKQANGSVIGRYGDSVVLATATMSEDDQDLPFFPLRVDYEERFYAVGEILGSRFVRREGKPSEGATLSSRLIDRCIRPLFDHRLRRSVQVMITILAYDEIHDLETISLLAASTALGVSDIPWDGPVGGLEIKSEKNDIEAFFAGPSKKINMIELGGNEAEEETVVDLFENAQDEISDLVSFQKDIIKKEGKEKENIEFSKPDKEVKKAVEGIEESTLRKAIKEDKTSKIENELEEKLEENEKESEQISAGKELLDDKIKKAISKMIIEEGERPDGRGVGEVRDLYSEVDLFNKVHGSGLFIRGDTQLLAMTTLAPPSEKKVVETIEKSGEKRFMLHYNFPDFSVGEPGRPGSPGRREIGHGALARKALLPFVPSKEDFPYTLRVVAETLSSNGSTSMGAICSSCMSLMDAGVDLKEYVAGIAMGLVSNKNGWEILTDIQGPEDHFGEMDLKVAGTRNGISAIQMDVKRKGITKEIFKEALPKARKARMQIIEVMEKAIPSPSKKVSENAPTILKHEIPEEKIGTLIGPGGKTIDHILSIVGEDEVSINIEDNGEIFISSKDESKAKKTLQIVKEVVRDYETGEVIEGEVVKLLDFGAIVEFGRGSSGMIHISEISDDYIDDVEDELEVGDRVRAKITEVEKDGSIKLSMVGVDQP